MKKYKLVMENSIEVKSRSGSRVKLYQIQALKNILIYNCTNPDVKAGDLGGFVQSEDNLSHEGHAWIGQESKVYDSAEVKQNAYVCEGSIIKDGAKALGEAVVRGKSVVTGNSYIKGGNVERGYILNSIIYGTVKYIPTGCIKSEIADKADIPRGVFVIGSNVFPGMAIYYGVLRDTPYLIYGSEHCIYRDTPNSIKIGCQAYEDNYWLKNCKSIGRTNAYSDEQIEEYRKYIKTIIKLTKMYPNKFPQLITSLSKDKLYLERFGLV